MSSSSIWSLRTSASLRWGRVKPSMAWDQFAVGEKGAILHTTNGGLRWRAEATPVDAYLLGVWGSAKSDVYAVGAGGVILHSDGETWSEQESGSKSWLQGVWGASAGEVYVVGSGGTILRSRDGGRLWTALQS